MKKKSAQRVSAFHLTKLKVVEDKERLRFLCKGFLFDRIGARCFASASKTEDVSVLIFPKVEKRRMNKLTGMLYAHRATWYVAYLGGPEHAHWLSQKKKSVQMPVGMHLEAALFKKDTVVVILGHKNRITRKYLKTHAEY